MNIISNKGMFLETIISNSIQRIRENNSGYISKMPVNHDIVTVENNILTGILRKNDNCDFIGIYKGSYLEFDAKETEKEFFPMSNIKKHQMDKLKLISSLGGLAFIIVYFHHYDRFFALNISSLKSADKKIPLSYFEDNGIELFLDNVSLNIEQALDQLWIS
jgi:recombination protein U